MSRGQSESMPKPLRVLFETGSMAGMTDGQLVERFVGRQDFEGEAAFAALVSRHGPMVLTVCRHLLGDLHLAEDAFQAVFMVLARRARSIRRPELLGPWLHGVATRVAFKARAQVHRRRQRERPEVEMANVELIGCDADAPSLREEEAALVHMEIGRLPERYRRAVVLCHFEGLTHAEAGRRLGCAPGTIGSLVSRGRDILRSRLARRGVSASALALAASLEPKIAAAAVPLSLERATIQAALCFAPKRAAVAGVVSKRVLEMACGALKYMSWSKLSIAATCLVVLGLAVAAAGRGAGMPRARLQEKTRKATTEDSSPGLPGAVTQPPTRLANDALFDLDAFFAAPRPAENAAPRYLDALFEFSPEMEICFPEGADRQKRKAAVDQRSQRFFTVFRSWNKDANSVTAAAIDEVISEFDTGFRKFDWAQQRPRCVFQTGIGATFLLPHAQAVGHVVRVARLKVRRELERGELDTAIRDLKRLLRLSRDLLPRGVPIVGIVSASAATNAVEHVVVPLLTTRGLTIEQCDRMLAFLLEHEAQSIDPYTEGLRSEYVSIRATMHDLVFGQARLRKEWENSGNQAGPSIVAEIAEPEMFAMLAGNQPAPNPAKVRAARGRARATEVAQEYSGTRCLDSANNSRRVGDPDRKGERALPWIVECC